MSRFSIIRKYLPFFEAWQVYSSFKKGRPIRLNGIRHLFSIRKNPFDFATFVEVLLRREYDIDLAESPANIIDAGANIGLTSIFLANKYPQANIIALEPDTENFNLLKTNVEVYPNVYPEPAGLWGKEAHLKIVDKGVGNNAFTVEEVAPGTNDALKAHSVKSIMKRMNWENVDLLKIDIEGSEKEVFACGYETWLPLVKVLVIELHDRMIPGCSKAFFKAISTFDFSFEVKGENLIFTNNHFRQKAKKQ